MQGQVLKRDLGLGVEAGLAEEVGDISGIRSLAPRVDVLEERPGSHCAACASQRLALQELQDLFLGHLERDSLAHVLPSDGAPETAVVHDGHLSPDVLAEEDLAVVTHHRAAGQLTHPRSGFCAHHLTVDSHILAGQGPSRFPGCGLSVAWGTSRFSPPDSDILPHTAGGFLAWWCLQQRGWWGGPQLWGCAQQPLLLQQGLLGHESLVLSALPLVFPPKHNLAIRTGQGRAQTLGRLRRFPAYHPNQLTIEGKGGLGGNLPSGQHPETPRIPSRSYMLSRQPGSSHMPQAFMFSWKRISALLLCLNTDAGCLLFQFFLNLFIGQKSLVQC